MHAAAAAIVAVIALAAPATAPAQAGGAAPAAGPVGGGVPTVPRASGPGTRAATIGTVNLRSAPGSGRVLRKLRVRTPVRALCTKVGPVATTRRDGPSRLWVRVVAAGRTGWVHDALVNPARGMLLAPLCGTKAATGPAPAGTTQGACAVTPPVKLLAPFTDTRAFIAAALPGARASLTRSRVPVSVTLAQGILETGGGKSSALGNNYFGIKARATATAGQYWWGPNAVGCTMTKTREAERAGLVMTVGAFRAYTTLDASILDHGDLLTTNPVYRAAFRYTNKPDRFIAEIARYYATDPRYRAKLMAVVRDYDLSRYDRAAGSAPTP